MLAIDIPGYGDLALEHLVLDMNGTIALDGALLPGVGEALTALDGIVRPLIITADTRGAAVAVGERLGVEVRVIGGEWEAGEKLAVVEELGVDGVVAIGNGANDHLMLKTCALGICVVGPEGAARSAVDAADVLVGSIEVALGLLADPQRLRATLRT